MAQSSRPQAGNVNVNPTYVDAGPYTADQWATLFRLLFTGDQQATQGVLKAVWNELAVTNPAGLNIQVNTGVGVCNGHVFINDTAAVTITVNGGANRSDAVCIVENNTNAALAAGAATIYNTVGDVAIPPYSARLAVVKNYPANASQTVALFMLPLYTMTTGAISISGLTDVRVFCEFSSVPLDGTVTTPKLADDAVDDTKAGNRVPQFYRRQGGNAADWSSPGSTAYTPGAVRMQAGSRQITFAGTGWMDDITITFPVAFSNVPLVIPTVWSEGILLFHLSANVVVVTATTVTIMVRFWSYSSYSSSPSAGYTATVFWLAIGPE